MKAVSMATSGFVSNDFFVMTGEERINFIKKLRSFLKNESYTTTKNKELLKVKKDKHVALLDIPRYSTEDPGVSIGLFFKKEILFFVSSVNRDSITLEFDDKELLKKGKLVISKNLTKKTKHFFTKEDYTFFKKLAEDLKDFFSPNSIRFINKL